MVNKLVYSYHDIVLSNKRNEMMIHATISIDLKRVILNEKRQSEEVPYNMISFT